MAQLVRRAARPLQRGAKSWLQSLGGHGQSPAAPIAAAEGVQSWIAPSMVRFMSNPAEAVTGPDLALCRALRSELKHEKSQYRQPPLVARGPPKPWTLTDTPGKQEIILRRSFGPEDIAVTALYQPSGGGADENDEDEDEDEDDSVSQDVAHLTVTVSKGGDQPTLEFSCSVFDKTYAIDHVSLLEHKEAKDSSAYNGPEYDDLDDELRNRFEDYLATRGVDQALTNYLMQLLPDKEQREYTRWLHSVENFVQK